MSKKSNQPAKNTLNDLFGSKTRIKILKFLFRKMLVKIGLINKKK